MYGTVHSCETIRGDGIPTVVLGNAGSEYVLGMNRLPYAFVLSDESNGLFTIDSSASFTDDTGPESTTSISNNQKQMIVTYKLLAKSTEDPPLIVEVFQIDGTEFDLTDGRLFMVDSKLNVVQLGLEEIDRDVMPRYAEGDGEMFGSFLGWLKMIRRQFPQIAG